MTVRLVDMPPSKPNVVVSLWTVTKDGQRVDAQLVDQSAAGCELRMLQNGEWLSGRRFSDRARAITHGDDVRQQLESRGWRCP
ncbi:MAG: hypothetical protein ABI900_14290 [Betaproteobacteria bacterium]